MKALTHLSASFSEKKAAELVHGSRLLSRLESSRSKWREMAGCTEIMWYNSGACEIEKLSVEWKHLPQGRDLNRPIKGSIHSNYKECFVFFGRNVMLVLSAGFLKNYKK